MGTPIPPLERFYRHTERRGACLIWTGTTAGTNSKAGYFQASTSQQVNKVRAHRWIYEQLVGPIPEGMEIDHVRDRGCTSSLCVEIAHLEPVTPEENSRRTRLVVCRSGRHDLTDPKSAHWDKFGRRRGCLECLRERDRKRPPRERKR